jgi:3-methyladenine DNA glycosylase AlkC
MLRMTCIVAICAIAASADASTSHQVGVLLLKARSQAALGNTAGAAATYQALAAMDGEIPPSLQTEVRLALLSLHTQLGDAERARPAIAYLTEAGQWDQLSEAQQSRVKRLASQCLVGDLLNTADAQRSARAKELASIIPGGKLLLDEQAWTEVDRLLSSGAHGEDVARQLALLAGDVETLTRLAQHIKATPATASAARPAAALAPTRSAHTPPPATSGRSQVGVLLLKARSQAALGNTAGAAATYQALAAMDGEIPPSLQTEVRLALLSLHTQLGDAERARPAIAYLTESSQWDQLSEAQQSRVKRLASQCLVGDLLNTADAQRSARAKELASIIPGGKLLLDEQAWTEVDRLLSSGAHGEDVARQLALLAGDVETLTRLAQHIKATPATASAARPAAALAPTRSAHTPPATSGRSQVGVLLLKARSQAALGNTAGAAATYQALAAMDGEIPPSLQTEVRLALLSLHTQLGDAERARPAIAYLTESSQWDQLSEAQQSRVKRLASQCLVGDLLNTADAQRSARAKELASIIPGGKLLLDEQAWTEVDRLLSSGAHGEDVARQLALLAGDVETLTRLAQHIKATPATASAARPAAALAPTRSAHTPPATSGRSQVGVLLLKARSQAALGNTAGAAATYQALAAMDGEIPPSLQTEVRLALLSLHTQLGDAERARPAIAYLTESSQWDQLSEAQQSRVKRLASQCLVGDLLNTADAQRSARAKELASIIPGGKLLLDEQAWTEVDRLLSSGAHGEDVARQLALLAGDVETLTRLAQHIKATPATAAATTSHVADVSAHSAPLAPVPESPDNSAEARLLVTLRLRLRFHEARNDIAGQVRVCDQLVEQPSLAVREKLALQLRVIRLLMNAENPDWTALAGRVARAQANGPVPPDIARQVAWSHMLHEMQACEPADRAARILRDIDRLAEQKLLDLTYGRLAELMAAIRKVSDQSPDLEKQVLAALSQLASSKDIRAALAAYTSPSADTVVSRAMGVLPATPVDREARATVIAARYRQLHGQELDQLQAYRQVYEQTDSRAMADHMLRLLLDRHLAPEEEAPPLAGLSELLASLPIRPSHPNPELAWALLFCQLAQMPADQGLAKWQAALTQYASVSFHLDDRAFLALDKLIQRVNQANAAWAGSILIDAMLVSDDLMTMRRLQWRRYAQFAEANRTEDMLAAAELDVFLSVGTPEGPVNPTMRVVEVLTANGRADDASAFVEQVQRTELGQPAEAPVADGPLRDAARALLAEGGDQLPARRRAFAMLFSGDHAGAQRLLLDAITSVDEVGGGETRWDDLFAAVAVSQRRCFVGEAARQALGKVSDAHAASLRRMGALWSLRMQRWTLDAYAGGREEWAQRIALHAIAQSATAEQAEKFIEQVVAGLAAKSSQLGTDHIVQGLAAVGEQITRPTTRQVLEYGIAQLQYQSGQYGQALETLRIAHQRVPDRPQDHDITFLQIMAHIKLGDFEGADQLLKTVGTAQDSAEVRGRKHFLKGWLLLQDGQTDLAMRHLRYVIDHAGSTPYATMVRELMQKLDML